MAKFIGHKKQRPSEINVSDGLIGSVKQKPYSVSDIFGNSENLVLRISVGLENPTDTLKPKANLNRLKLIGKPLRVA